MSFFGFFGNSPRQGEETGKLNDGTGLREGEASGDYELNNDGNETNKSEGTDITMQEITNDLEIIM